MRRAPFFNNPVLKSSLPLWRARLVFILLFLGFAVLAGRALFLQGLSTEFLQQQGERRYERTLTLPAVRGKVTDRHGEVLASSVPARAIWAIPEDAAGASPESLAQLASLLEMNATDISARLSDTSRNFVYLKRQVPMDVAEQVQALKVPGVSLQPEMRRYYPERDVAAHLVGFTNLDGRGQEGVELAFESMLSGKDGSRRVIRDRLGRVIEDVRDIHPPIDGQDIRLSIDMRLQFAVYKALQDAMEENKAKGAAAVVLDVRTGEVLALVNLPPAYRLPAASTARAETEPSTPLPRADQAVPSHLAIALTLTPALTPLPKTDQVEPFHRATLLACTPPAAVKVPPA